jgi:hypothetical protein
MVTLGEELEAAKQAQTVISTLSILVENCSSSFENGAHFVGIDDPRFTQRLGFQTHQPRRYLGL